MTGTYRVLYRNETVKRMFHMLYDIHMNGILFVALRNKLPRLCDCSAFIVFNILKYIIYAKTYMKANDNYIYILR